MTAILLIWAIVATIFAWLSYATGVDVTKKLNAYESTNKNQTNIATSTIVPVLPEKTLTIKEKVYKFGTCHGLEGYFDKSTFVMIDETQGMQRWWKIVINDQNIPQAVLHRVDGPAIRHNDGLVYYYLFGQNYSKENFNEYVLKHLEVEEKA